MLITVKVSLEICCLFLMLVILMQLFSFGKDEARQHSGVKSSSSSRSFPDDFDDTEFPCPFDVDDDDVTDPGSR